jgi:hypothetical protein
MKKNSILIVFFLLGLNITFAQTIDLNGSVKSSENVEGIHVFNKTKTKFTTTNRAGAFTIEASIKDTLVFSSIQHKLLTVVIAQNAITNKSLEVTLESKINALDEVVVGCVLSGNLQDDISTLNVTPQINFYNVGIPGYQGKPKTKSERLLAEAGEFKPKMLLGLLGGSLELNPIINAITGRTKELKKRVALEANTKLMMRLKSNLGDVFFKEHPLEEDQKMDFFFFCSEDKNFMQRCSSSEMEAFIFLKEKYQQYQINLKEKD